MISSKETSLIANAQRGDLNAFNQLILNYQGLAFSIAMRTLQDEASAADTVQESFIKAYRAIGNFQGGSFKSWLLRIVVNSCYDVLRSQKRRTTDSLDDLVEESENTSALMDRSESPHEYAERMELNQLIEAAIQSLPPDQRMVLALCDVHGHSYEEIVEITDLPMGTVKSRINRARAKMRDYLLQRSELLPASFRPK
ncbi:MAG: sigma-70 family RNA polymerase sigma factor [Caldilineaceae bacterium]